MKREGVQSEYVGGGVLRVKEGWSEPFRESIIIKYRSWKETPRIEERELENFKTLETLEKRLCTCYK